MITAFIRMATKVEKQYRKKNAGIGSQRPCRLYSRDISIAVAILMNAVIIFQIQFKQGHFLNDGIEYYQVSEDASRVAFR